MTALLWIPLLVPAALALASALRPRDGWTRVADLAAAVVVLGTGWPCSPASRPPAR